MLVGSLIPEGPRSRPFDAAHPRNCIRISGSGKVNSLISTEFLEWRRKWPFSAEFSGWHQRP
jgi:hypothetical protein